jgi:hypothetical protein
MNDNTPISAALGAQGPIGGLATPKLWAEQTDAEKIETLRSELLNMRYVTRRVAEVEAKMHRLNQHEHGEKGILMVPLSSVDAMSTLNSLAGRSYDPLA